VTDVEINVENFWPKVHKMLPKTEDQGQHFMNWEKKFSKMIDTPSLFVLLHLKSKQFYKLTSKQLHKNVTTSTLPKQQRAGNSAYMFLFKCHDSDQLCWGITMSSEYWKKCVLFIDWKPKLRLTCTRLNLFVSTAIYPKLIEACRLWCILTIVFAIPGYQIPVVSPIPNPGIGGIPIPGFRNYKNSLKVYFFEC